MSDPDHVSHKAKPLILYEEYRLIEKNNSEINGFWKGIHLLLFFLVFIFGSLCTTSFHVLTYMFDKQCVLYPKLIYLRDLRRTVSNNVIFDYIDSEAAGLPIDFVSTRWMDKSTCYLPTYVPLLSSIFGLIWTTMYIMCSSGNRYLTGLQRPWRIQPAVFIMSIAMGIFCLYVTIITQNGLNELCIKLSEITGSNSCTYTINVATLLYERRIRGVYQATRLIIMTAWLHTLCWFGAAFTALLRVLLVVDFKLIKVRAELRGNIDKILERYEKLLKTDDYPFESPGSSGVNARHDPSVKVRFVNKPNVTDTEDNTLQPNAASYVQTHYISREREKGSLVTLVPTSLSDLKEYNEKNTLNATGSLSPQKTRYMARPVETSLQIDEDDSLPDMKNIQTDVVVSKDAEKQDIEQFTTVKEGTTKNSNSSTSFTEIKTIIPPFYIQKAPLIRSDSALNETSNFYAESFNFISFDESAVGIVTKVPNPDTEHITKEPENEIKKDNEVAGSSRQNTPQDEKDEKSTATKKEKQD